MQQLKRWSKNEQGHRVFYLYGPAGTGKSTIARTFAEINLAEGNVGAVFFCSRDSEDRSNLRAVFPTLAFQLARQHPQFRERLLQVLRITPDARRESVCSQMEKFIVGPLKATRIRTLIIIAALDECRDKEAGSAMLSVLSRYVDEIPQVKFFLTGRQNPTFHSRIPFDPPRVAMEVFELRDTRRSSVDRDIKLFFRTQLTDIAKTRSDSRPMGGWPSSRDIDVLCEKAGGLFIYASTVVRFVASERSAPATSLDLVTSLPRPIQGGKKERSLHELYTLVLKQASLDVRADQEFYDRFRSVVGALLLLFNPLPMGALSSLLGVPDIPTTLRSFRPLLLVPTNRDDFVKFFHKSFPNFLTDPGGCKDSRFFIDPPVHHREILLSCLNLMKGGLKKNICDLDSYASLAEVEDLPARRKARIGDVLEYACLFWARHLAEIPSSGRGAREVCEAIDEFSEIGRAHV